MKRHHIHDRPHSQTPYETYGRQKTQALRLVKKMLAMGNYPSQIKTAIAAKYHLSRRSVERYMTRARREMEEFMDEDTRQHRADSYYFYLGIIENVESTQSERFRARVRLDKLLGIEIPSSFHQKNEFKLKPQEIQNMSDEEFEDAYKKAMK